MAIAYDTTTDVSANSGVGVNATISASTTFLLVHGIGNATNTLTSATVKAGGVSMVQIGSIEIGTNRQFCFGLMNPPTGTISIIITLVGDTAHLSRASSYTGSKSTGQPAQSNQGTGAMNLTTSALTLSANSWLIMGFRNDGAATSAGANTTIRTPSTNNIFTADSNAAESGSQTLVITNGASGTYEYTQFELQVGSIVTPSTPLLNLLGVGT